VTPPPLADVLVERCRLARPGALPDEAIVSARHCLLDWFGVALAGSREPAAGILAAATAGGGTACSLVGRAERAGELEAALVNGTASHALDFDDMHVTLAGHPSVAIVPALLAAAERDGASGEAVLAALVAGVEAACLLGAALNPSHYDAGWHSTGTLGALAAAAACSHLLRADDDAWRRALALAATQAAGLRVMFGTMAKPLHAGRAAANGLLAARLAARGFTASPDALDAPRGFAALHDGPAAPRTEPGERWAIEGVLFKYHAACFGTHASIDNARAVLRDHDLALAEIALVELRVPPDVLGVCDRERPRTGLEAKFSLHVTTALALLGRDLGDTRTFADAVVSEPAVTELAGRIRLAVEPAALGNPGWAALRLVKQSGEELTAETDAGLPERDLAAREKRLRAKFRTLAGTVLPPAEVAALEEELLGFDRLDDLRAPLARCAVA
jgi:2-methylcitrate dehydratase PrpD